jgi:hypothetical protein
VVTVGADGALLADGDRIVVVPRARGRGRRHDRSGRRVQRRPGRRARRPGRDLEAAARAAVEAASASVQRPGRAGRVRAAVAPGTVRYDVADGVATLALDQPETRNALSDHVLDDLVAAFERARDDAAVPRCRARLDARHDVLSGGDLAGFAADVPLIHKHLETTRRFPALFTAHRRARQARRVCRPRALSRRGARPSRSRATS